MKSPKTKKKKLHAEHTSRLWPGWQTDSVSNSFKKKCNHNKLMTVKTKKKRLGQMRMLRSGRDARARCACMRPSPAGEAAWCLMLAAHSAVSILLVSCDFKWREPESRYEKVMHAGDTKPPCCSYHDTSTLVDPAETPNCLTAIMRLSSHCK